MATSPNIAVVVLDTLRYDLFDSYFNWLSGTSFTNAYSTSHWTVPAHASLFTGLYASETGVHSQSQSLDCEDLTISEVLQKNNYRTRKYTANLNIHTWNGWDRGFDINIGPDELVSYYDVETMNFRRFMSQSERSGTRLYLSIIAECFRNESSTIYSLMDGVRRYTQPEKNGGAKSVLSRLKQTSFDENEFLFINLMDTHVPYYPPEKYRTIDEEVVTKNWEPFVDGISNLSKIEIAYEDSVRYLSDIYKEIFIELRNEFDYVITLSDHGEMLGEYGLIDHAYGTYPQLSHIPLVVSGQDITNSTVNVPVSILDVHATIADLAGVEIASRGQSLIRTPEAKDRLVEYHGFLPWLHDKFIEKGITEQEYEELNQPLRGYIGSDSIYSFETHRDGFVVQGEGESTNIVNRQDKLNSLVADLDIRQVDAENGDVDNSVMSRLEDLGYA